MVRRVRPSFTRRSDASEFVPSPGHPAPPQAGLAGGGRPGRSRGRWWPATRSAPSAYPTPPRPTRQTGAVCLVSVASETDATAPPSPPPPSSSSTRATSWMQSLSQSGRSPTPPHHHPVVLHAGSSPDDSPLVSCSPYNIVVKCCQKCRIAQPQFEEANTVRRERVRT